MKEKKEFTVFIASPGDLPEERDMVRAVCDELNKDVFIRDSGVSLHAEGWEDVFPAAGRPQKIINALVDRCDLFICMFHRRFGYDRGRVRCSDSYRYFPVIRGSSVGFASGLKSDCPLVLCPCS